MLTDKQRELLRLIQRCDPSLLIHLVKEGTNFDAALLGFVFDLAKDQASALLSASAAPGEGREPTGDELRKLVREIRDASGGPSDAPQPADYVLGGWRAAVDAAAPTLSQEIVGYLVDDPNEPDIGHWFDEGKPSRDLGLRARPLIFADLTMSDAVRDVLAERRRVVEQEGFTAEHDDEHTKSEMAFAAAAYAMSSGRPSLRLKYEVPGNWPWDSAWWKPTTQRQDLVKAGQLIIAEIERLDRADIDPKQQ